jgi:hypothetical protein
MREFSLDSIKGAVISDLTYVNLDIKPPALFANLKRQPQGKNMPRGSSTSWVQRRGSESFVITGPTNTVKASITMRPMPNSTIVKEVNRK